MSWSRPYYDGPDPGDPQLEVVYDSVVAVMSRNATLEAGLVEVASLVEHSIAPADGAGVALMEGGYLQLRAASTTLADAAEEFQYSIDEGPCLTASREGRTIRSGDLGGSETRWPRFSATMGEMGIGSVLSLPLQVRQDVIGSINIYSVRAHAFRELDEVTGLQFAEPAAAAIRRIQVDRRLDGMERAMHHTLRSRGIVTDALDFLCRREGCTTEEAQQLLAELAEQRQWSLVQTASALLVDDESGDRPTPPPVEE